MLYVQGLNVFPEGLMVDMASKVYLPISVENIKNLNSFL